MRKVIIAAAFVVLAATIVAPASAAKRAGAQQRETQSLPRCRALALKEAPALRGRDRFLGQMMDQMAREGRCVM